MKVLVVFYSRTGNTRALARQIAAAMNAKMEEITDRVNRNGIFGYLRSGNEAWFRQCVFQILPPSKDPGEYNLVISTDHEWPSPPAARRSG